MTRPLMKYKDEQNLTLENLTAYLNEKGMNVSLATVFSWCTKNPKLSRIPRPGKAIQLGKITGYPPEYFIFDSCDDVKPDLTKTAG